MTTKELIRHLQLKHLKPRDVERVEEAFDTADLEAALTTVDALIGKRRVTQGNRRRATTAKSERSERRA